VRPASAIIDDCRRVALQAADWSAVLWQADVRVFTHPWRDENDLVQALAPFGIVGLGKLGARFARYAGAFDICVEPLPAHHPLRSLPNVVLTPHLGCVVADSMERFHRESVENVQAWLRGAPLRVVNAEALPGSRPGPRA